MFATSAFAQTAAGAGGAAASPLASIINSPIPLMVALFAMFYFMILRPQQTRAKQHKAMIENVKRGDTVVLSNGMIGKVVRVEDAEVGVEISQGVTVKVVKAMLSEVRVKGEVAPANDAKS
ncbi:preprotein translocase subunit YajC [soil metagenome]